MPDHTAFAPAFRVKFLDSSQHLFGCKILLITGDLLLPHVEQGVAVGQLQQSFRPAKRVDQLVLRRGPAFLPQLHERFRTVILITPVHTLDQASFTLVRKRRVDQGLQLAFKVRVSFFPD